MFAQLPLDDKLDVFKSALARNVELVDVLHHAAKLDLPGWY